MKKIIFWFCFLLGAQNTNIYISPPQVSVTGLWTGFFLVVNEDITIVNNQTPNEFGRGCEGFLEVYRNGIDQTSISDYNFDQTPVGFRVQFRNPPVVGDLIKIRCFRGTWQ